MKISSVEIAFRLESIKKSGIIFNELLGAGAKYSSGEESAFLFECLKKGLKIYYVPEKIASLHIGNSSWFKGYNKEYFISKGAAFAAMSKKLCLILILQFAIRKYKIYKNNVTFIEVLKHMLNGRKMYNNEITNTIKSNFL